MRNASRARGLLGWAGLALTAFTAGVILPASNAAAVLSTGVAPVTVTSSAPEVTTVPPGPATATTATSSTSSSPAATTTPAPPPPPPVSSTTETTPAMAAIPPSPVTHLLVPAIGVDTDVLPVDSKPTGKTNAWGGVIYGTIDFPVDDKVRQWIRRGDPNSLPADQSAGDAKAFDRVLLYGHASDIGNHLVFQDLSALKDGDRIVATTDLGVFTYAVTLVATSAKYDLSNFAPLYDYPVDGVKEIALVACLPDTTNNMVVIGALVTADPTTPPATGG